MSKGLPEKVKLSLHKALDAALLAVETYNKPAVKFKSGGYIVLMSIAWTSLFHAIFFRKGTKPFYKKKDGIHYIKKDDEYQFWELNTCAKEYFKDDTENPMIKNIEFFIPLRNKLEHKFMPELDANIFAECQSLLLNFDKIVEREFGESFCLRESLSFALQLFPSRKTLSMAIKEAPSTKRVYEWIDKYRSSISTEVQQSGEYSFKAFLIQVANHNSKDTLPIQFYPYDSMSDDEKKNVEKIAALVKTKQIVQPVSNVNLIKPSEVVEKVQQALGNVKMNKGSKQVDKFNADTHTRCWKKYKIRPNSKSARPEKTTSIYCVYDSMNKNYGYTQAWVDFLIEKISNEDEYNSLYQQS